MTLLELAVALGAAPAEPWRTEANCAGVDPGLFFPERGESLADAKAVCAGCSVRQECFDYSMERGERYGIWGGIAERERRKLRRERNAARRAAS